VRRGVETLYTIGYTKKSLERFVALLREAGVDAVVDVRRFNTSQLAGWAKRDDLSFLLREAFGIAYLHLPALAPTPEMLKTLRASRDWPAYDTAFRALMAESRMVEQAAPVLAGFRRPCLLCAEPTPEECHRRLLAEAFQAAMPGLAVQHLE
jgi:uncharacterized protein (DUF488 family)